MGGIEDPFIDGSLAGGEAREWFRHAGPEGLVVLVGVGAERFVGLKGCGVHEDAGDGYASGPPAVENFVTVGVKVTPVVDVRGAG